MKGSLYARLRRSRVLALAVYVIVVQGIVGPLAQAAGSPAPGAPSASSSAPSPASSSPAGSRKVTQAVAPADSPDVPLGGSASSYGLGIPDTSSAAWAGGLASVEPSTGAARASLPFELPLARGTQPSLSLLYDSTRGDSDAGVGWSLSLPSIERRGPSGLVRPQYQDPAPGAQIQTATQDRFVFAGQQLVPICYLGDGNVVGDCEGRSAELMPAFTSHRGPGWHYYRLQVERGATLRFFWSPDHLTWIVQSKAGISWEFGAPSDGNYDDSKGSIDYEILPSDAPSPTAPFRWRLVRQYDANRLRSGVPANPVVYQYNADGTLSDIFDTPPAGQAWPATQAFAHHVALWYEAYPFARATPPTWRRTPPTFLTGVDVTSASVEDASTRDLVRRYHLDYLYGAHHEYLLTFQVEGRCAFARSEDSSTARLPATTSCPTLPSTTLSYTTTESSPGQATPTAMSSGAPVPPLAIVDVNSDGLPDILQPANHTGGNQVLWLNSASGQPDSFVVTPMIVGGSTTNDGPTARTLIPGYSGWPAITPSGEPSAYVSSDTIRAYAGDFLGDGNVDVLFFGNQTQQLGDNPPPVDPWHIYGYWPSQTIAGTWQWSGGLLGQWNWDMTYWYERWHDAADLDGDGLIDRIVTRTKNDGPPWNAHNALYTQSGVEFSTQTQDGHVVPFGYPILPASSTQLTSPQMQGTCGTSNPGVFDHPPWLAAIAGAQPTDLNPPFTLADMDGDGLLDIVIYDNNGFNYWRGHGNGWFGDGVCTGDATTGLTCTCGPNGSNSQAYQASTMSGAPEIQDAHDQLRHIYMHDVTGDGLADLVIPANGIISVWENIDGTRFWAREDLSTDSISDYDVSTAHVYFADMNGSGVDDVVVVTGQVHYFDLLLGVRPGLLNLVDNGLGASTRLEYSSIASLSLEARRAGSPGWLEPQSLSVVTAVSTSNGITSGTHAVTRRTEYSYDGPLYDARERVFRGFQKVSATKKGDQASGDVTTDTSYAIGQCPSTGTANPCALGIDNPYEAIRGLPLTVEVRNASGVYLSTTHAQYSVNENDVGIDGRNVYLAYAEQRDTWLYDDAGDASCITVTDIESTSTPMLDSSHCLPLRGSRAKTKHLKTTRFVEGIGSTEAQRVDWGNVADGGGTPDQPIEVQTTWLLAGTAGNWIWRPAGSRTFYSDSTGQNPVGPWPVRELSYQYDAAGNLLDAYGVLTGSRPLARHHEDPTAKIAPSPQNASADGQVHMLHRVMDSGGLGDVVAVQGPDSRCSSFVYDKAFQEVPVQSTVSAGAIGPMGCGETPLTTIRHFDLGLGMVDDTLAPDGAHSVTHYDGFGRVASVFGPDPLLPGTPKAEAGIKAQYFDEFPQRTLVQALVSDRPGSKKHPGSTVYRSAWQIRDGLGALLAAFTSADPSAGDGGAWVLGGVTDVSSNGLVLKAYQQAFSNADPRSYAVNAPTGTSFESYTYDGFARPVEAFALDGSPKASVEYHPLTRDVLDADNLAPGSPHAGAYDTLTFDGHGRAVELDERFHTSSTIDVVSTRQLYLATGELWGQVRQHGSGSVVHVAEFDSLGRMVANYEPNSSSVGLNTSTGWLYAYDDAGDLVGTSDARGCGENLFYDAAGRVQAEDFSPCRIGQEAYSDANPSTGEGTEAFYVHDAPDAGDSWALANAGRLTAVYDRGAHTRFHYDLRGRLLGLQRQLAVPGDTASALAARFATHWFQKALSYDDAGEVLSESTGADVAELLGAKGESSVSADYSLRGLLRDVGGSYGSLITKATYDADTLPTLVTYGDAASTTATFQYDPLRRLQEKMVSRGKAPAFWTKGAPGYTPPPPDDSTQELLEDSFFHYDPVGNPTAIEDRRHAAEWPQGAKPVQRSGIQYDDLYRVTQITYDSGGDTFKPPSMGPALALPTMAPPERIATQSFLYDWLGNTTQSTDDKGVFFDRSLGVIQNGVGHNGPPNQLQLATNGTDGLSAYYDAAGNLEDLVVQRTAFPCSGGSGGCTQRFHYEWDEVGQLMRARRWDFSGAYTGPAYPNLPSGMPAVDEEVKYDASGQRALKEITAGGASTYSAEVFPSLVLDDAAFDSGGGNRSGDYERDATTEQPYATLAGAALGRLVHDASLPTIDGQQTHVLLEITDHLGSTATVVDNVTGELASAAPTRPTAPRSPTIARGAGTTGSATVSPASRPTPSWGSPTSARAITARTSGAG